MLGVDQGQQRIGEMMLADLDEDVGDLDDFPGRRLRHALARLEGVERRTAGQPDCMADLRQHGVSHRLVGRVLDQLDAERLGFAQFFPPEVGDGLNPEGLEIGLRHGEGPVGGRRGSPLHWCDPGSLPRGLELAWRPDFQ